MSLRTLPFYMVGKLSDHHCNKSGLQPYLGTWRCWTVSPNVLPKIRQLTTWFAAQLLKFFCLSREDISAMMVEFMGKLSALLASSNRKSCKWAPSSSPPESISDLPLVASVYSDEEEGDCTFSSSEDSVNREFLWHLQNLRILFWSLSKQCAHALI